MTIAITREETLDVVILGAGAAGLLAGLTAGRRGRRVVILDHGVTPGEKVRIAGGGRCNFTNRQVGPEHYLSNNAAFCISALRTFSPADFLALVERHGIGYHEEEAGQIFCNDSGQRIVAMLLAENKAAGVEIRMRTRILDVARDGDGSFVITIAGSRLRAGSLVIATGGLSIPKMGATDLGWRLAQRFGLAVVPPRPGLTPLIFAAADWSRWQGLAGIACHGRVQCGKVGFTGPLLFTHRGLSGPVILQISSYWSEGAPLEIDLTPGIDLLALLKEAKQNQPRQGLSTALGSRLPRRLAQRCTAITGGDDGRLADLPDTRLAAIATAVQRWRLTPQGTEGYRMAEVTLGGVDTRELSSKSMACRRIPNLFFIGEVVDVTGHLGGYNLQWAWSSGHAAGLAV